MLQGEAERLGIANRVIFIPAVPHEQLWMYTGMADIGLCNIDNVCLSYYYSLPNKLFEYIQALVPVVGSKFPEIEKIVEKYGVGETCNPEDPESIAFAIRSVISRHKEGFYTKNLSVAKKELCWENESKVLESAYKSLISSRHNMADAG